MEPDSNAPHDSDSSRSIVKNLFSEVGGFLQ
jgi:hypothetical protein